MEVEQRERSALLTMVADRTNRAVVVTDTNLTIVYANAAFASMFGYTIEEAMGQKAVELLVGRGTDRKTLAQLRRWIDEDGGGEEDILAYDKHGEELWISANVKGFPYQRRTSQIRLRTAERHHRDQAVALPAAADHVCAGR